MAHINKLNYKKDFKNLKSDIIAKGIFEDEKHWTISSGQMKGKVVEQYLIWNLKNQKIRL